MAWRSSGSRAGRTAVHRDRPARAERDLQRPGLAAQHRAHVVAPGGPRDLPRWRGVAGVAHGRDRGPGDHRRDRRRGRLAARRLAAPPPGSPRARGGPPAPRDRRNRGRRSADDRRRDHRRGVGGQRSPRGRRGHDRRLAQGSRHRLDEGRPGQGPRQLRRLRCGLRAPQRARGWNLEALVDRLLRRDDRAQPVLPAQGRAADPLLGGRPPRRPAAGRTDRHPAGARFAAGLLPRGHDRGGVQRDGGLRSAP